MVITNITYRKSAKMRNNGSMLVLAVSAIFILSILGLGILTLAYGTSLRSVQLRNETAAKLAAEAGYEKAISLMSSKDDVLSWLGSAPGDDAARVEKGSGQLTSGPNSPNIDYDYSISFDRFDNIHPVYKIEATGKCSLIKRTITAFVTQRIGGWEMGICEVPTGSTQTTKVLFTGDDDVGSMPIHINSNKKSDDSKIDIPVDNANRPFFRELITMEESRYKSGRNSDKYAGIMDVFDGGIYFNQPENRITETGGGSIQKKVDRFLNSTHNKFRFYSGNGKKPTALAAGYLPEYKMPAVQLEFFVDTAGSIGKVRITNNCTVCCVDGSGYDYKLAPDPTNTYERYPVYAFHYAYDSLSEIYNLADTYVKQQAEKPTGSLVSTEAGGQIYVDGNVIIGGEIDENGNVRIPKPCPASIKGKVTVVATGNIWIVSPAVYHGHQDISSGFAVPAIDNPNILGLFSVNGVVKVVDAGLSINVPRDPNDNDLPRVFTDPNGIFRYQPICLQEPSQGKIYLRRLPEPMVVQASVTVGGGGWGVENVFARLERKTVNNLVLAGSITEVIQGLVASSIGEAGFKRHYYFDKRLQNGILPGDIWFQSKYIPIKGGWADTRYNDSDAPSPSL